MIETIIALSKEFISIRSCAGNPDALDSILKLALTPLQDYTVEYFESNKVKSALVYNTKRRPEKFRILLNGHLDIIPGKDYQYKPRICGKKLYGAGSMDMKANAACLITVFKNIAHQLPYPIGLQLVTDEEIGGFNGTKYQIKNGVKTDFVITGEPTGLNIVTKAKGILWVKITSAGKTAHGAYPWKGENAIWKMYEFLHSLQRKYPIPSEQKWATTVNLSSIDTNNISFNKIPDNCTIWLDIRFIPEESESVMDQIKKLLPEGFLFEIVTKEPAFSVNFRNRYVKLLQETAEKTINRKVTLYGTHGSSDARHFMVAGCAGVEFGPSGGNIGGDKEWVDIASLGKYSLILKHFLENCI